MAEYNKHKFGGHKFVESLIPLFCTSGDAKQGRDKS